MIRKIATVAMFELKRIFKKPQSYIIMFGMPLLFTLIFGSLLSGGEQVKPTITIVNNDNSTLANNYIDEIQAKDVMKLNFTDEDRAASDLSDHKITGYILIEKGFEKHLLNEEKLNIMFKHSPEYNGAVMIKQVLHNSLQKIMISTKASTVYSSLTGDSWEGINTKISNELKTSSGLKTEMITKNSEMAGMQNMSARSAGFTIMFVMMAMLSSTGVILEAKQTGVWYRLMATPTSRLELLLGYLLGFFLIGWVQFGILMAVSTIIFNITWGNIVANIILISALLICTIGISLFIAGFVKTSEQQAVFGNLVIISTCMLAGVYWPLEIVPNFMQEVARFVPQFWALEGLMELMVRGGSIIDIVEPIGILLAFAIVFLGVGITRVRFD
ncbi:putative transport permease YfiN [Paraliobacillus quinghaiensis]|uniref:Transport permease YfiN n=1 Tax=Paraliobacillus quinghaiensis TaxID=470815 RepID=A0A917WRR0_9BACI|nr:ABC transporter permease [Paraliobacillus quinghaiensis]GGM23855.1 putative transport permease YfiN [Paraliobacillus quinghaiensis]